MVRVPLLLLLIRRNLPIVAVSAAIVVAMILIGVGFFYRGKTIMETQLKEKLRTTAAVASQQFSGERLDEIQGKEDMNNPYFLDLVFRLDHIRQVVPEVKYAYIMRKTENPMLLAFVADADSLGSFDLEVDASKSAELEPSYPGDLYPIQDVPALQKDAFVKPSVDDDIVYDDWGALISGYAPIYDNEGRVVATLGIDMDAERYAQLSQSVFSTVAMVLVMMLGILLASIILWVNWKKRLEMLNTLEEERSAFLRLASHQLGAPLTTFRWWLEILKDDITCEPGGACDQMEEAITRMNQIVDNLMEAGKLGTMAYTPVQTSLNELVTEVVTDVKKKADIKKQVITVDMPQLPAIKLDRKLISGVIRELLDNAVDYSSAGKDIAVHAKLSKKEVTVTVEDHGCGIPMKDMDRIFHKFVRGSNAPLMRPNGNGIGLFLAKGIIERVGGAMWVQSKEGKGSIFSFTLPIVA